MRSEIRNPLPYMAGIECIHINMPSYTPSVSCLRDSPRAMCLCLLNNKTNDQGDLYTGKHAKFQLVLCAPSLNDFNVQFPCLTFNNFFLWPQLKWLTFYLTVSFYFQTALNSCIIKLHFILGLPILHCTFVLLSFVLRLITTDWGDSVVLQDCTYYDN